MFAGRRRSIEVPGNVMARQAGEEHLLHRVAIALDLAVDGRLDGPALRHRPQALGNEQVFAEFAAALLPRLARRRRREWEVAVEIARLVGEPVVGRRLPRWQ